MVRIGKKQLTALGLALALTTSLMAGGCATKSAQSEMAIAERAEQAATRAEAAAARAEQAANDAAMMAEKTERMFNKNMKK